MKLLVPWRSTLICYGTPSSFSSRTPVIGPIEVFVGHPRGIRCRRPHDTEALNTTELTTLYVYMQSGGGGVIQSDARHHSIRVRHRYQSRCSSFVTSTNRESCVQIVKLSKYLIFTCCFTLKGKALTEAEAGSPGIPIRV